MRWDKDGYEGRWVGSGMAAIGRIWMQPGARSDASRTFVAPANAEITITGSIRKDPSAQNGHTVEARILHNDRNLAGDRLGRVAPEFAKTVEYRVERTLVAKGDSVRFVLKHSGHIGNEPVIWNPTVVVARRS